jgi:hypothetical protein
VEYPFETRVSETETASRLKAAQNADADADAPSGAVHGR